MPSIVLYLNCEQKKKLACGVGETDEAINTWERKKIGWSDLSCESETPLEIEVAKHDEWSHQKYRHFPQKRWWQVETKENCFLEME